MTLNPETLRDRLRGIVRPGGAPAAPAAPTTSTSAPPSPLPVTTITEAADSTPDYGSAPAPAAGQGVGPQGESGPSLRAKRTIGAILGGEWREDSGGRSFVVTRRFEADARYGQGRVGDFGSRLAAGVESASLVSSGVPRPPFVFFDLETTGLSGGAGTHAFLVGCARFDPDGTFVIEQHLMADYAAERAMLGHVAGRLGTAGALVSFNGKSFDAPVLETRYLFHRLASPCAALPHLDVLHPARRFWSGDADRGCSLVALERQVLGARRVGDVPGFEIPARYFQFVRSGDAQPLADVFEHNRLDLLSLAGIAARLLSLIDEGAGACVDAREALALARIYERAGQPARSEQALERTLTLAAEAAAQRVGARSTLEWGWTPHGIRAEALRALALSARRSRRFADAAEYWRQVLDVPGCPAELRREATEALAIHHEHRDRNLSMAKMFALKSLEAGTEAAWGDAVRHRLARIERKMISDRRSLFPSSP